ncbi:MAG TPA: glycoside hydrolase N-terminal domain-containing protein [Luteolibacter sp.]
MQSSRFSILFLIAVSGATAADPSHQLNYRQPAQKWESEALPIGNGRMGAMLFGGVGLENIQFNEQSLWSGDNNWDGAYECGDHGFGAYRNFGDIKIRWDGAATPEVSSPSGHAAGNGQAIDATLDGQPDTKWCIEAPGASVTWLATLPIPQSVKSYTLTSANDVPARDPQTWILEGSADGNRWQELDRQALGKPFETRGQTMSFEIARPTACKFYRFTFTTTGLSHFQIADATLAGVSFASSPKQAVPADYTRALDPSTGIHTVSYTVGGTRFTREAFASRPDQVMVFHYTAGKKAALSGSIELKSAQKATTLATPDQLSFAGEMPNKLKHACMVRVLHRGGKTQDNNGTLTFDGCDSLTLLVNARTNYAPDFKAGWRGADPLPRLEKELAAAERKPYTALRTDHVKDLSALLDRVGLDVGTTAPAIAALPTDERLRRYADTATTPADPDLEETMFRYGRYLLASCSRPGGLPANLQGLWNDSNTPAWASDYHNNINVQMNYWGAETTNLAECHEPLIDYVVAQAEPCRIATRKAFGENTRGWTARTSQSIFGGNGWEWNIPASAWYAAHLFDHYAFTRDHAYLKTTAYPALKEICQLWEDRLKALPDGTLVVPNGWSPEHGPREDGVMHDQQLVWELFQDYLEAAKDLGVDADYQKKVADMRDRLAPNKIGKWGQLQEWQTDRDDPNDHHRHTSHLFAVYPGRQINPLQTPQLADAARISLKARSNDHEKKTGKPFTVDTTIGDSRRSWTWPWRGAMWARLGEGERAGIMVRGLLTYNVMPNLFCTHPPFQIDGNFGITGAMAEMLLQSHAREIALLPALPQAWAAKGSFTGLKARGDYTVDCTWVDGKVTDYQIRPGKNARPGPVKVRVNGKEETRIPAAN